MRWAFVTGALWSLACAADDHAASARAVAPTLPSITGQEVGIVEDVVVTAPPGFVPFGSDHIHGSVHGIRDRAASVSVERADARDGTWAFAFEGRVLGTEVIWRKTSAPGSLGRQATAWLEGEPWTVTVWAADQATLDRMTAVASTLRRGRVLRALPECDASTVPLGGPLPEDSTARALALAPALAMQVSAPEREHWRRILVSRNAASTFRAMAVADESTVAGRIYGLAGLHALGTPDAEALTCALRPPPDVEVVLGPGCPSPVRARDLYERAGGQDVASHWSTHERANAVGLAPLDLRGGGVTTALAFPLDSPSWLDVVESSCERRWPMFVGPEMPIDLGGERRRWLRTQDDDCWVASDGHVACLAHPVPSTVLAPVAIAFADGAGCVLGSDGSRACFVVPDRYVRGFAARCGAEIPVSRVVRFEDGPWSSLTGGRLVCARHADAGAIRCFDALGAVTADLGGAKGVGGRWWFTRDGEVHDLLEEASRPIVRFAEGIASVAGDPVTDELAVQLRDGRTLLRLTVEERAFFEARGARARADGWVEVPELESAVPSWGRALCGTVGDRSTCFSSDPWRELPGGAGHPIDGSLCLAERAGLLRCRPIDEDLDLETERLVRLGPE